MLDKSTEPNLAGKQLFFPLISQRFPAAAGMSGKIEAGQGKINRHFVVIAAISPGQVEAPTLSPVLEVEHIFKIDSPCSS